MLKPIANVGSIIKILSVIPINNIRFQVKPIELRGEKAGK